MSESEINSLFASLSSKTSKKSPFRSPDHQQLQLLSEGRIEICAFATAEKRILSTSVSFYPS